MKAIDKAKTMRPLMMVMVETIHSEGSNLQQIRDSMHLAG